MNFRSKLVAIAGSALILASSLTMGAAETTAPADPTKTNASVSITDHENAGLTVSVTAGEIDDVTYSFTNVEEDASLTVTATDYRGSGAGWHVNLSATDFIRDDETSFSISNLSLTTRNQTAVEHPIGDLSPLTGLTVATSPVSSSSSKIWAAAELRGAGKYTLNMTGKLNVPGGTLVGDYTSLVSVEIVSGP